MPAIRAALLPHPPLLVPDLAGAAAPELDGLRQACREALRAVLAGSRTVVVLGDGPVWGMAGPEARGSFAPYGADLQVGLPGPHLRLDPPGLPEAARLAELPLSLSVAAWLFASLAAEGAGPQLIVASLPLALGPRAAAAVGRELVRAASGSGPVGVVAMGDLSARRTPRAPGALHPAAAGFDAAVSRAVAGGDLDALAGLDPALAAELMVAGRAVLQALAGALQGTPGLRGRVLYDDAPYGVGYVVAVLDADPTVVRPGTQGGGPPPPAAPPPAGAGAAGPPAPGR